MMDRMISNIISIAFLVSGAFQLVSSTDKSGWFCAIIWCLIVMIRVNREGRVNDEK